MMNDINLIILNNAPRYIRNVDNRGIADFKIKLRYECLLQWQQNRSKATM